MTVLLITLLAAGSALSFLRPRWGIAAVCLVAPFTALETLAGFPLNLKQVFGLMALAGFAARVAVSHGERVPFKRTPLDLPILLLGLSYVIGFSVSIVRGVPGGEAVRELSSLLSILLFYFLIVQVIRSPQDFRFAVGAFLLGGLLLAGSSLYFYLRGEVVFPWGILARAPVAEGALRLQGFSGNPNTYASLFTLATPLSLLLAAAGRGWRRAGMAAMSLVFAVAVVLSFSRSAYLAILASCGVVVLYLCWLAQVRAAAKAAGIAALCFLALLLVLEWVGALPAARTRLRSSADYQSLGDRRYQYPAAVRMLLENPLGVGLGRFTSEVGSYGGAERGGAHNDILAIAAESGFLGMGAVLLLIWTQLRQLAAGVRRAAGARRFLVAGFLAGTVSFWVHSFFHTSAHWVLVWIFFALGAEACRLAATAETAGTPIQSRTYAGRREPTPRLGWRAWPGGAGARTTSAVGKRRKTGV